MIRIRQLVPRFVTHMPQPLEPGVLYVSMEYATSIHLCCCGCGEEVVTPLAPTDWSLTFNGDSISLWPSIGNWNFKCRSHYIIEQNRVLVARPWSDDRVEYGRFRDKVAKERYYGRDGPDSASPGNHESPGPH